MQKFSQFICFWRKKWLEKSIVILLDKFFFLKKKMVWLDNVC